MSLANNLHYKRLFLFLSFFVKSKESVVYKFVMLNSKETIKRISLGRVFLLKKTLNISSRPKLLANLDIGNDALFFL